MEDSIKVNFVIPGDCVDENYCTPEMKLAYTACEQHRHGGLKLQWIHERECTNFEGLTKKDVFVLGEFDGPLFERLKATKCLLVGPRCLSCCFTEGTPIPNGPGPVFTIAMRGLIVTVSGLTKPQKDKIKQKVQWMGGIYSTVLTEDTTHLVSNTVLSDKYIKSVEKGIPIMSESWIDEVWEVSLQRNVNGSSPDFKKHQLPTFANLEVTTSGISKKEKMHIMKLINENGGRFSGAFQSETTDIVILNQDGVTSEKYKAALEYGKACVEPRWAAASAARGAALPAARFRVGARAATSSPLAAHAPPDMSLNFSRITNLRPPSNFIDETRSSDVSTVSTKSKLSQDMKKPSFTMAVDKEIVAAFENLDMSDIKKAGPIFDGFCIWVCGPEGAWRERACACVSRGGGVRYDAAHERVTHAVAAGRAPALAARRALPAAPVLSALWLRDSVRAARALPERDYLWDEKPPELARATPEPASPMSKRNLQLLRAPPAPAPPAPPTPARPDPDPARDDLVQHYLSQNMSQAAKEKTPEPPSRTEDVQPDMTEEGEDEVTEDMEQIFQGLQLEAQALDEAALREVGAELARAGGALAAAGAGAALALVPLDFDVAELVNKRAEPVTVFWIKDCLSQQELVPLQYYHRPVSISERASTCLEGVVLSLSTYSGVERAFLDELAKLLGARTQLRFCRRTTASALASTHLLCPAPAGDKYAGAVKWGLPAVRARWLLRCAAAAARAPEAPDLVGDTRAPAPDTPDADEEAASRNDSVNKENDAKGVPEMGPPAEGSAAPRRQSSSKEGTPRAKLINIRGDNDEMSPASRYIAMARQGLLGGDTQDTPPRPAHKDGGDIGCGVHTPPLEDALSTPNLVGLSPTTRRRLLAIRKGEMPSDPIKTPIDPSSEGPATPDSAFGAALRPGSGALSPASRKRLWSVVQALPAAAPAAAPARVTPLSEIRNRFLAQFNNDSPIHPADHTVAPRKLQLQEQVDTPPPKIAKINEKQTVGSATLDGGAGSADAKDAASEASGRSAAADASALPAGVDAQLQRLSAALSARADSPARARVRRARDSLQRSSPQGVEEESGPESQPNTVGWDDTTPQEAREVAPVKKFMLSSNVDNREEIAEMIRWLGGEVCEGGELEEAATHLLCAAPARSEKMLGSVAAGKWVLHPAYVPRSRAAGAFLPEEEFEWGNPGAAALPALGAAEAALARAAHRWRRARAAGGAFAGVRALLHVPAARRRLLARLLRAGGGDAPDLQPPYSEAQLARVSVCFADARRAPLAAADAALLRRMRVPVCAPVLLSAYLTDERRPRPEDHCLPEFRPQ